MPWISTLPLLGTVGQTQTFSFVVQYYDEIITEGTPTEGGAPTESTTTQVFLPVRIVTQQTDPDTVIITHDDSALSATISGFYGNCFNDTLRVMTAYDPGSPVNNDSSVEDILNKMMNDQWNYIQSSTDPTGWVNIPSSTPDNSLSNTEPNATDMRYANMDTLNTPEKGVSVWVKEKAYETKQVVKFIPDPTRYRRFNYSCTAGTISGITQNVSASTTKSIDVSDKNWTPGRDALRSAIFTAGSRT